MPAARGSVHALIAGLAMAVCILMGAESGRGETPAANAGLFLRVETGEHQAQINRIALLADGGAVVSVSDDKTARLWSRDVLQPQAILHPPLGDHDDGALYAVAASQHVIAVAGRIRDADGLFGIAMFSADDGHRPLGVLGGLPAAVMALRFSPDGTALAAGLQNGAGLRVFDLKPPVHLSLKDEEYAGDVTWLDFDGQGRLAVAADDGKVRLYGTDGRHTAVVLPNGGRPWGIAFSPDGKQLAVGDRRRPVVHLLDAAPFKFTRDLQGGAQRGGSLTVVAYAPNGKALFASGNYVDKSGQIFLRRWDTADRGGGTDTPLGRDLVTDIITLQDGLLYASAEPSLGKLDGGGALLSKRHPANLVFDSPAALLVSEDGAVVGAPAANMPGADGGRILFSAKAHGFVSADAQPLKMVLPAAAAKGLAVTEWQNSHSPRLNGTMIRLEPAELARSVAVLPDGASAAFGTDYFIRLVGRDGEIWHKAVEAPAWAINASGDGRVVVAGLGDGTIHWYNAASGRELQALYLDLATQRWVLWTPEGFFDHDHRDDGQPDGRTLIGYRFNLPNRRSSRVIEIGQLYPIFFRPDLVGLSLRDDAAARAMIDGQYAQLGSVSSVIAAGLPPRVHVLEVCGKDRDLAPQPCIENLAPSRSAQAGPAAPQMRTAAAGISIRYRLTDASGRVGVAALRRNGAVIAAPVAIEATEPNSRTEVATLSLAMGLNVIQIVPASNSGEIEASESGIAELRVMRVGASAPVDAATPSRDGARMRSLGDLSASSIPVPQSSVPRLYVLSVGVGQFLQPDMRDFNLDNAANDAQAVADLFRKPSPPVYDAPDIRLLDGIGDPASAPTTANILAALQDISRKARPDDIVLIFLAGHGQDVDGKYYFAPADMGLGDPALVQKVLTAAYQPEDDHSTDLLFRTEGVGQDQLLALIQAIQASHVAVLLDTCYSGTIATADAVLRRDLNSMVTNKLGHAVGRFVLSSSFTTAHDAATGASPAAAGESERHGLFTDYLLKALQGEADFDGSHMIDIYKLATYTKKNVLAVSGRLAQANPSEQTLQEPAYYFAGNDFFALRSTIPTATP
jgi:hypothetical protein